VPNYDFPILPSTKVAALLDRYPELEEVLIGLPPPFKKLKNPLLRKGVAKVASLRNAAAVGGITVHELVNKLRAAVGQEAILSGDQKMNRCLTSLTSLRGLQLQELWLPLMREPLIRTR
jgi:hypothetical protein